VRERVAALTYAAAWKGVRVAPEPLSRVALRVVADASYRRNGTWVQHLSRNLRRVLGADVSDDRLSEVTRAAVRSYLRYWTEVFRLPDLSAEQMIRDTHIEGTDRLRALHADPERGSILVLPHMGNWDAAGAWCVHLGMPFTTVAERLRPASLFDRFVAFRRSLGMEVLPLTGGSTGPYPVLRARLEAAGTLCLLADRDLTSTGVTVRFFGEPARMPAGPAALALDTGAALVPVTLWFPEGDEPGWRGRVHDEITVPMSGSRRDKVVAMTQAMADTFAASIAEHPCDWHMVQRLWVADLDPTRDALRTGAPEPQGATA
jgi:KDO2-lipid IV(A) lauroyltransferase